MRRGREPVQKIEFVELVKCENDPICGTRTAKVSLAFTHTNDRRFAPFPHIKIWEGIGFPELLEAYSRLFAKAADCVKKQQYDIIDYQI